MIRFAAAAVALTAAAASPLSAQTAADHGVEPWSEAVVSVADLEESAGWLIEHGGWRKVASGALDRAELEYWNLPTSVAGAFLRVCAAQAETGCIRFVRFDGAENQRPIRLAARPWDTGGIFSIMLRTDSAQAAFDAAIARGWWAESEPYRFSFGGSDLANVVVRGPHGVNYALYEREAPPFTGFPIGPLSQAFNTMRMVKDQPASLAWYRDGLGFGVLFDAPFTDPEPRSNNFSVPANLATTLVRRAAVAQPVLPGETGRIEVMQFEGFEGRDFAAHASPPNWGILSVRYPVGALASYRDRLETQGIAVEYAAENVAIAGLGKVDLIAVRDPDGNLTEFYHAD
ncbi:VOC family protein [Erythrobacter sp. JK5]|uniref:VOC family protein n=1 Tax=Erythrobacter sp. JK5 TaxID=2829500 RepID=UPI001BA6A6CD|nr:VOC family protein [Erythrobacter sp. JK5]QUL36976.1 VOC family protein [Erythrobacter sp. JK5]